MPPCHVGEGAPGPAGLNNSPFDIQVMSWASRGLRHVVSVLGVWKRCLTSFHSSRLHPSLASAVRFGDFDSMRHRVEVARECHPSAILWSLRVAVHDQRHGAVKYLVGRLSDSCPISGSLLAVPLCEALRVCVQQNLPYAEDIVRTLLEEGAGPEVIMRPSTLRLRTRPVWQPPWHCETPLTWLLRWDAELSSRLQDKRVASCLSRIRKLIVLLVEYGATGCHLGRRQRLSLDAAIESAK